jgi:hypothetical protein
MSLNNNIQNALTHQLSQVPSIPTIAYANADFEPEKGVDYVRPTLIPARSEMFSLEEGKHSGIYQVDIYTELNKGTAPLLLLADSIRDKFISDRRLTSGSDVIFIQEISISPAQRVEGWWSCYVEINYICFN